MRAKLGLMSETKIAYRASIWLGIRMDQVMLFEIY